MNTCFSNLQYHNIVISKKKNDEIKRKKLIINFSLRYYII